MAVTRETLRLSAELRIIVGGATSAATRRLVVAWARAWEQIEAEWIAAIDELIADGDGVWPSKLRITRAARAERALRIAYREIVGLAEFAGVTVMTAAADVTGPSAEWQARLIASQMPPEAGTVTELAVRFDRVDPDAIAAIVERSTEQITALTRPLPERAIEAMMQALVRGVAVGENPRTAARRMLAKAEGAFNGGLTRALTIARTEILDAHRSAAAAAQFANTDVLAGWVWLAKLDKRTCPSCWSKHGGLHDLDELGPNDHQQGRCARMPQVRTWAELGFSTPEPPSLVPDAQAVFAGLGKADQLAVMGPVRLQALNAGAMGWDDLTVKATTRGWRDSHVTTPVSYARRKLVRAAP